MFINRTIPIKISNPGGSAENRQLFLSEVNLSEEWLASIWSHWEGKVIFNRLHV